MLQSHGNAQDSASELACHQTNGAKWQPNRMKPNQNIFLGISTKMVLRAGTNLGSLSQPGANLKQRRMC